MHEKKEDGKMLTIDRSCITLFPFFFYFESIFFSLSICDFVLLSQQIVQECFLLNQQVHLQLKFLFEIFIVREIFIFSIWSYICIFFHTMIYSLSIHDSALLILFFICYFIIYFFLLLSLFYNILYREMESFISNCQRKSITIYKQKSRKTANKKSLFLLELCN